MYDVVPARAFTRRKPPILLAPGASHSPVE